jgi:cytochrome c-type biogenesis protein CcmH
MRDHHPPALALDVRASRPAGRTLQAGLSAALAVLALLWLTLVHPPVHAADAPLVSVDAPASAVDLKLEARMLAITTELRCLVCQNQTIADSHAPLAIDLRQQVRELIDKGKTNAEIIAYMTERYGDFVLYRPPFKATTALLWVGPGVLLVAGLAVLIVVLRRRSRLSPDRFEPEPDDQDPGDPRRAASN